MANVTEIMQMCRLCLVKEEVNVPIFEGAGDIRQILEKIKRCLPVKVDLGDNLPKKICDGCVYKLDLCYQFYNKASQSEKQLLTWLTATDDVSVDSKARIPAAIEEIVVSPTQIVKEEPITESYENQFNNFYEGTNYRDAPETITASELSLGENEEPPVKKRKKTAAYASSSAVTDSDEDADDPIDTTITKTEDESDEEEDDENEDLDSTEAEPAFVDVSQEASTDVQPGPSGIQKPGDSQYEEVIIEDEGELEASYQCEVCSQIFPDRKEFLSHHMSQFGSMFTCCRCGETFANSTNLYSHYDSHKLANDGEEEVILENYSENVEAVMNIPTDDTGNELLYILDDDSQCVNEVVIEDSEKFLQQPKSNDGYTIVQVDHGYMIPSVFKGQLETKRRYKKKPEHELIYNELESEEVTSEVLINVEPSTSQKLPRVSVKPQKKWNELPDFLKTKKRHEMPDFSAANYEILPANSEVNITHYKCLRCEQLFINKFVFFRHIEKGKCYINSCDVCPVTFTKNTEFYEHYTTEHTERAICNFCFRTFMYEKNVKEHMLRHLDQFRHRCEECNKGFYTVREYRNHYKNRHMGIRHKCEECGRSFADEYYFKRHLATHGIKVNDVSAMAQLNQTI